MVHRSDKLDSTWLLGVFAQRRGEPESANPYKHPNSYYDLLDKNGWQHGWEWAKDHHRHKFDAPTHITVAQCPSLPTGPHHVPG